MFQEVSVFLFEKRSAEKLHKPKRKETVTEILRASVRQLERFRHPKILQVNIRIQFCSPLCTQVNCSRSKLSQCLAEGNITPLCFLLSILIQHQKSIAICIWHHEQSLHLLRYIGFWSDISFIKKLCFSWTVRNQLSCCKNMIFSSFKHFNLSPWVVFFSYRFYSMFLFNNSNFQYEASIMELLYCLLIKFFFKSRFFTSTE